MKSKKKKHFPIRYLPKSLTKRDKEKQVKLLNKSKKLYKKNIYYTRTPLVSYKNIPSKHIIKARKIFKVDKIIPSKELSLKTGCKLNSLKKIVRKGEGAFFSSGSRPNQSPQSWGYARLASSITGGKAAAVDFKIIENGCDHNKKAYKLAKKSKIKYKNGHSKTKKVSY
jgi:hypothetical protein